MRSVVPVCLFVSLAACGTTERVSYAELEHVVMQPYADLAQQKAELWELGFEPQVFEFEGHGKVTVREWQLTGWPGNVFVNARVRYENTTEHPVTHAIVWLEVLDSQGEVAGSSAVRLTHPMGVPFWPGYMYSLEVRTPTNDAHLDPDGWQWGIACRTLEDDDPGDKPVLVVTRDRLAEGLAPGSNWTRLPLSPDQEYYYRSMPRIGPTHVPGAYPR